MALKSFPKSTTKISGCVLSSTPLQSPEDSGYFGSGDRRYKSNVNALVSCSPINELAYKGVPEHSVLKHEFSSELPQIRVEKNLDFECLEKNESLTSIEVNDLSEQELISSNFSSQHEFLKPSTSISEKDKGQYNFYKSGRSLKHSLNSLSSESDIKYNLFDYEQNSSTGLDVSRYTESSDSGFLALANYENLNLSTLKQRKTDFICELRERNCFSIIASILSCLSAKELCIASCVSKEWNEVILQDTEANSRRKSFLIKRNEILNGPSKENRRGMRYVPAKEHKSAFSDLTNITDVFHPTKTRVLDSRFDSFIKESKNTRSKLIKCPRCSYASKCLNGNVYKCTHCSYNFCFKCLNPIFKNHTCYKAELPSIIVGSKKSKKNLKRL